LSAAGRLLASLPAIFIAFIAVGVSVIVGFSWAYRGRPSGAWHWTMIALVVAVMVAYGVVLRLRSRTAYATEGDGDTFYYLGFIYTLATLVATFGPLLNSTDRPDIRHVLGLFGLGLSTTFVGLVGRIVFAQTSSAPSTAAEDNARRLGDAYAEAAHAIERSTVRIVNAQRRAEGHLNESYSGAIDAVRTLSARATEQLDAMSAQVVNQFSAAIERIGTQAESVFAELLSRAAHEIDGASQQVVKTHEVAKGQLETLAADTTGVVRTVTDQMVQDFTRSARESAAELSTFVRQAHTSLATALQEFDTRIGALRLPPEDVGQKLVAVLTELTERAQTLRRATATIGAAYGELEGTLAGAVQGARDGSRAFSALAVSADEATTAVTTARTNVEQFATQLSHVGQVTSGLETLPQEATTIAASLRSLRGSLTEASRAWTKVAGATDGATKSITDAGAALSSLESGTRAAEQSVLNWSGGLTKASLGLEALTEVAERAVRLGHDAMKAHAELSAEVAGPLAEQLRKHGEAAGALVERLQDDLREAEDAVRKVHHHLIDASRFILSKVEYRR
jgi:hypothetical protein